MVKVASGALTVYYDGGCPVCRREIAMYQRQPGAERCAWVDASSVQDEAIAEDLSRADALARMHVRRADGQLVDGAAAFIALWQALPSTRWLGRVAGVPPLPWLLELGYRGFLRVRRLWRPRGAAATTTQAPPARS